MHSVNLLVTDRSPETAEHVNSLLRNSGIKIHVLHAKSSTEIKRALDADLPVLILYANPEEADAPLIEVAELAAAFSVPVALYTAMDEPEKLANLLSETACFVINSGREDLLTEAVTRLITSSENERLSNGSLAAERMEPETSMRKTRLLDGSLSVAMRLP